MMVISSLYPIYVKSHGVGYACCSILEAMNMSGVTVKLYSVATDRESRRHYQRLSLLPWAQRLGFRLFSKRTLSKFTEWRYLRSLRGNDIAYIWPGTSVEIFKRTRLRGCIVVAENINTHQSTSKAILDAEYRRLGLVPTHGIDEKKVAEENAKLEYVDFIFSPSDEVTSSLIKASVPREKIISTSYGLSYQDILSTEVEKTPGSERNGITAIFVGSIGIRKGAPLLLHYWVKAGVRGTLKLVGNIDADARHLIEPFLSRPDIQHIGFCDDLKPIFRDADLFVFPSLEEGSPLVTYLSLGAGLPSLVSPMGGGGIIRNGVDGIVLDPHDEAGWINAIRSLGSEDGLRREYGDNAREHAHDYLWEKVGRQRLDDLQRRLTDHGGR